jgi:hypothetical protein
VLIMLTLSPVTAPFSTCELGTFYGSTHRHESLPFRPPSQSDRSASSPGTILPAVGAVGARVRLLTITGLHVSPVSPTTSSTFAVQSLNSHFIGAHAAPVTNLRV